MLGWSGLLVIIFCEVNGGYDGMMEVEAKDNGSEWNGEEGLLLSFSSIFFVHSFSS